MSECKKHGLYVCEAEAEISRVILWGIVLLLVMTGSCGVSTYRKDQCIAKCARQNLECREYGFYNSAALCVRPTTNNIDVKVDQ